MGEKRRYPRNREVVKLPPIQSLKPSLVGRKP